MRILMVGAGATGGYYGGRLAQAGRDVTFLVRGKRLQQLQERGIEIVSPLGNATVQPKVITADALPDAGVFDVVIVSTKAYSLEAAMNDFAPAVGAETVILPVLNGMKHLDILAERFGRERIMPATVRIVSDMDDEGRIHQLTELDAFIFGEMGGGTSERAEKLREIFSVFGFSTTLSENVLGSLWMKWWILTTMGAVCVISGGTVGEMVAVPYGAETSRAVLSEAVAIVAANGFPADPSQVESHARRLTEPGSNLTSSMYRDMTKGYPVEADHILGDFLARRNGVSAPLLTGAYVRLKVYENSRGR
jgi:2-dehydropantoate 2-reductase